MFSFLVNAKKRASGSPLLKNGNNLLLFVLAFILLYFFFKSQIKSFFNSIIEFFKSRNDDNVDDTVDGGTLTLAQVSNKVNELETLINSWFGGSNSDIVSIFDGLNKYDVIAMKNRMGTKCYNLGRFAPQWECTTDIGKEMNMYQALKADLSDYHYNILKTRYPDLL